MKKEVFYDKGELNKRKNDGFLFICLLGMLACTYPFVFQFFLPLPSISLLIPLTFLLYFVFVNRKQVILRHPITKIAILQLFATIFSFLISSDSEYIKQFLYIIWAICFISLLEKYGIYKFLFYYNRFILAVAVLGCVSFVFSILFGVRSFYSFPNGGDGFIELVYTTFTNSIHGDFIRYGGVFDEPGAMAFWGMFSLVTNKLYVKDDSLEKPLIFTLLFTLSLAYIIQLTFYYFFFYFWGRFSFKRLAVVGIIGSFLLFYLLSLDPDSYIYRVTLARVGIGSSVDFVSDNNRADLMDISRNLFKQSPLFGVGPSAISKDGAFDNPYETLARDGIFGAIFIYLPLVVSVFYSKYNRSILYAAIILFIGYLQRPFHFQFLHYTMLYIFFYAAYTMKQRTPTRVYNS